MKKIFNFGLLFDKRIQQDIIDYSGRINSKIKSEYLLNEKSLPHITILQFIMGNKINEITDKLFRIQIEKILVNFYGLAFLPSVDKRTVWVEISVKRNDDLLKLQNKVFQIIKPKKILNSFGNLFRPHVTLSRCNLNDIKLIQDKILDSKLLIRQNIIGYPCLGSGSSISDYNFRHIIHKFS